MLKHVLSTLFISAISLSTLIVLPQQVTVAKKPNQSPLSWANITQTFFSKKRPVNPRKGGSRPTELLCMISPDALDNIRIVWSDRPLFIWQGNVKTIAVKHANSNEILWSEQVKNTQQFTYTGEPLQPGQIYTWEVNSVMFVKFQVMETQQRDRITTDLQNLEKQLKDKKANLEAIALAKANYFAQNQLWSDVLQQMYSVNTPDPELENLRKQISQNMCKY